MRYLITGLLACLSLVACDANNDAHRAAENDAASAAAADAQYEAENESQRLNKWFAARYEEQLRFSPITLTFLGRKELYDQVDDFLFIDGSAELSDRLRVRLIELDNLLLLAGILTRFGDHALL